MEKRGLDSPDDGDALALTFAHEVPPVEEQPEEEECEEIQMYNPRSWMKSRF